MAFRKEDKEALKKLGLDPDKIETAAKADAETAIEIPQGEFFSTEQLTTLKTNEYNTGKKAGEEMAVKGVKEELKLDFQGKTVKGLVEAAQKKALDDAKIEPDKKVQELQQQLTTVQTTATDLQKKLEAKDAEVTTAKVNSELYKYIPSPAENGPALEPDDVIGMARNKGYEFKMEDGKTVAYKNGVKEIDKLGNVRPVKEVLTDFMKEKKLISDDGGVPGGRGDGDKRPGAKATKLSELKKTFTDQGKSLNGQEFANAVEVAVKENKDFDMKA